MESAPQIDEAPPAPTSGKSSKPASTIAARHKSPRPQYHHERHRQRRHSTRLRSLKVINLLLAIVLVVVFIGWINTWVTLNASEKERYMLASELRQTSQERDSLLERNATLSQNLKTLVQQRLPGLHPLSFDSTVTIDRDHVRNISFTRTGVGGEKRYEYSLVLENHSRDTITPTVSIRLFDESGIQTGSTTLTKEAATSNADFDFLEPGEIRAYTAPIETVGGKRPVYFQVVTR